MLPFCCASTAMKLSKTVSILVICPSWVDIKAAGFDEPPVVLDGPKCLKVLPIERQSDMLDEEPDPELQAGDGYAKVGSAVVRRCLPSASTRMMSKTVLPFCLSLPSACLPACLPACLSSKDEPLAVRAVSWSDDGNRLAVTCCGVVDDQYNDDQGGVVHVYQVRRAVRRCLSAVLPLPVFNLSQSCPTVPLCCTSSRSTLPGSRTTTTLTCR
eukprot:SAG22_NODE_388_length_11295_cov_14.512594_5_plen_213_part_00